MKAAQYTKLKDRVEELRERKNKALGAKDSLLARLQEEFGCKTLQEAQRLLKKLTKQSQHLQEECEAALKDFEDTYGAIDDDLPY